ncbi:ATP-binding cassette-type vacuolar membrane transporter Hmt1 [Rhodotorula kratochvilovae]
MTAPDLPSLYTALGQLRLALPCILLGLLTARWLGRMLVGMMSRIQSAGWHAEDDIYAPPELLYGPGGATKANGASGNVGDERDEITPVVVKAKAVRKAVVLVLMGLVALTYFADGVAQVVATLITSHYTPSDPLYGNIVVYSAGGVAAFTLLGLGLIYEGRQREKSGIVGEAPWPMLHPRLLTFLAFALEVAILGVFGRIVVDDPLIDPKEDVLPVVHLAILALRVFLAIVLFAFQFRPFYRATYLPSSSSIPASERTPLLGGASAASNGYAALPTAEPASAAAPSVLRGTRIPSNRPQDPKSLSVLTLFKRVRLLFPYLWPSKSVALQVLALICFGLMIFKRYLNVARPIFFGRIISDLAAGRPPYLSVCLYLLVSFLSDSNTMLYQYLWLPIEQYSEREMAMMSFDTLLNLSLAYHTRRKTGELLRILSRSEAINDFFELLIFSFIPILIDLPVAFVVLSVRYGAVIVAVVTIVSVIYVTTSVLLAESRTKLYRELRDQNQFAHQIKTDTLMNYEGVKIFVAEAFESKRLRDAMWRYQRGYFAVYSAWNSLSLLQNGISNFGLLVCSFILAHRVVTGKMDPGEFATFTSYFAQLLSPLNQISSLYRRVMSNAVDTEQLIELLNEPREIQDKPNPVELSVGPEGATISFEDVHFSYDGKVDVLKGVSFTVPAGKTVALVGPSGSGKSTLSRLLFRMYDATSGAIRINGTDVRDLSQRSLRAAVGLVPQECVLANASVRFNIAYGGVLRLGEGRELTMEDVVEAAKAAAMHDRIMGFADQYETLVGERGMRLSGGEKQRIAIARTLLKDPPILVLDEATSALDTHNERLIQNRLKELSKGRTSLTVAHRLSTIVDADVICVLKDGLIVEQGSHAELLAIEGGVYAELWAKQIEGQEGSVPTSALPSGATTPVAQPAPSSAVEREDAQEVQRAASPVAPLASQAAAQALVATAALPSGASTPAVPAAAPVGRPAVQRAASPVAPLASQAAAKAPPVAPPPPAAGGSGTGSGGKTSGGGGKGPNSRSGRKKGGRRK